MHVTYETSYGKRRIPVYLIHGGDTGPCRSEDGGLPDDHSSLRCLEVDIEVFGDCFLQSYLHGDNTELVATDSMKNFVMRHSADCDRSSLEGFLHILAQRFLRTYPRTSALRLSVAEQPTRLHGAHDGRQAGDAVLVPPDSSPHGLRYVSSIHVERAGHNRVAVVDHLSGLRGLRLLKARGSSFVGFIRDEYTSLPECEDRPLQLVLDTSWCYRDILDARCPERGKHVDFDRVHTLLQSVFINFRSQSIQHLLHEMGMHLLREFPQLSRVSFEGQNCTWSMVHRVAGQAGAAVYTEPFPAYGLIRLAMARDEDR